MKKTLGVIKESISLHFGKTRDKENVTRLEEIQPRQLKGIRKPMDDILKVTTKF